MEFCHLIEYKMKKIFLKKSCANWSGEASPRPFFKKSKLSISLDQQPEMFINVFLFVCQIEVNQNMLELRC